MANILFVMKYPLNGQETLIPKFQGQMAAMERLGHRAWYLGWDEAGIWLCRGEEKTLLHRSRFSRVPGYSHTFLFDDLMEGMKNAVRQMPFALVYLRYMMTFSKAPSAFRAVKASGAKLAVEHPTYPFANGKKTSLLREPVFRYADRIFRQVEPMIDLYTLIGEEAGGSLHGRPALNITNGVDADRLPLHRSRGEAGPPAILALASMTRGQGYDRLLRAMAPVQEDYVLYFAGGSSDGSLEEWQKLSQELGIGEKARFLGPVQGAALDELTARCDVGMGGLGIHRLGQSVSRPLKQREYMARGLPFFYAVNDPDMPEDESMCRRLPDDETIPDGAEILRFARESRLDAALPARMRAYAREHLGWERQFKPVLERLEIPWNETSSI